MSSSKNSIRAGIAGDALVVSFLSATAPRVWRAEMSQLTSAAFEVQENQGKFSLVMKRSGAPVEEIGTFPGKNDAVAALQLITEALLQGNDIGAPVKRGGWFKRTLKFLVTVIAVLCVAIVVMNIFMSVAGRHMPPSEQGSNSAAPAASTAPTVQPGMPAPADEIIGK